MSAYALTAAEASLVDWTINPDAWDDYAEDGQTGGEPCPKIEVWHPVARVWFAAGEPFARDDTFHVVAGPEGLRTILNNLDALDDMRPDTKEERRELGQKRRIANRLREKLTPYAAKDFEP